MTDPFMRRRCEKFLRVERGRYFDIVYSFSRSPRGEAINPYRHAGIQKIR
jgi:hypothetical protein